MSLRNFIHGHGTWLSLTELNATLQVTQLLGVGGRV